MSNPEPFDLNVVQDFFDHVYQDRGMVKWQGFYLSDHTHALKKQRQRQAQTYPPKPQQSLAILTTYLQQAYLTNRPVAIQLNERDQNDSLLPDICGRVTGYYETDIVLDGWRLVALAAMRHVDWTTLPNRKTSPK